MKYSHQKFIIFLILISTWLIGVSSDGILIAQESHDNQKLSDSEREDKNIKFLDAVFKLIRTRFYDKNYCGLDLDLLYDEYLPKVKKSETQKELHTIVNEMIARFKVSHFAILEREIYQGIANERTNSLAYEFGFKLRKLGNKFFATRFSEGGATVNSGLLLGDEILEVNGVNVADSDKLLDSGNDVGIPGPEYYVLKASKDEKISLKIKRTSAADPIIITLKSVAHNEIKSIENSVSVIEKNNKKFAYIHTWHFLTRKVGEIFWSAINEKYQDCDAMILDIRGHGGNMMVIQMMLAPFTKKSRFKNAPKWEKPLVVLIDEGSRSAKEIFAHVIKRDKLGTLVGRNTQGAVLATTFFPLPDGSALMLPISDALNLIKGRPKLEGVGVAPDVEVEFGLKYAKGTDKILEAGILEAEKLFNKTKNSTPEPSDTPEPEIIEDF